MEAALPELRAFIRLRLGPTIRARESSSDLLQSVCREALLESPTLEFRGERAFRRWLFTVAERKIIDRARYWNADRRNPGHEGSSFDDASADEIARLRDSYAAFMRPSREADLREQVERLEAAFQRLSERDREVLTLSRLMGMSHAEVAESLGIAEGAARMALARALTRLSTELRGD